MKFNIINISPQYSAFWKCGINIHNQLQNTDRVSSKYIDLWSKKNIAHNKYLRMFQLLNGIELPTKHNEINIYVSPLLAGSLNKNSSKLNIILIHDFWPLQNSIFPIKYLFKYIYKKINNSDIILSNSSKTKEDFISYFGNHNNIFTIHLGLHDIYFKSRNNINKNSQLTFISIGRDEYRKNLGFIIKMLKILKNHNIDFKLDRVGEFTEKHKKMIKRYNLSGNVDIMANVSEKHLIKIYSKAHFILMPSLYEGFGLPVLEAMSRKCIPIVSNKGALPEIANNLQLVNKLDLDLWVNKILKIWNNNCLRKYLIKFCYQNSKNFIWKQYISKLLHIINLKNIY